MEIDSPGLWSYKLLYCLGDEWLEELLGFLFLSQTLFAKVCSSPSTSVLQNVSKISYLTSEISATNPMHLAVIKAVMWINFKLPGLSSSTVNTVVNRQMNRHKHWMWVKIDWLCLAFLKSHKPYYFQHFAIFTRCFFFALVCQSVMEVRVKVLWLEFITERQNIFLFREC